MVYMKLSRAPLHDGLPTAEANSESLRWTHDLGHYLNSAHTLLRVGLMSPEDY